MKNIFWLLPLAGALLGFAASYLALYLKLKLAPVPGYTRATYRVIETFDLKSALFSTALLMVLAMGAAGGYPVIRNLLQPEPGEPDGGNRVIIPMPMDSLIRMIPQPKSVDPNKNTEPPDLGLVKRPALASRIVLVDDNVSDTTEFDDRTNNDIVNSFSNRNSPANDSLIRNAVIDNNAGPAQARRLCGLQHIAFSLERNSAGLPLHLPDHGGRGQSHHFMCWWTRAERWPRSGCLKARATKLWTRRPWRH